MKNKQVETVENIDTLIREGQGARARAALLKVNYSKLPRELKLVVASLSCRADIADLTVRILNPIVTPAQGKPSIATEEERAEYAIGLIYIGALSEGMQLLEKLDTAANPRVLLYRAHGFISQWNYSAAIPLLEKAISGSSLGEYQKLVCKVNLAASLVHERRYAEATPLLERLKEETAKSFPLHGNVVKYWAELKIETRDFKAARMLLEGGEQAFEHFGGRDGLLIRKWKAIVDLIETGASRASVETIHRIKDEARSQQHWEIVRDCDFYKAIHMRNKETFLLLYFGTPFESYRQRMLKEWKEPIAIPEKFVWHIKKAAEMKICNVLVGEETPKGEVVRSGQMYHRLLYALSSDFYRPFRLAQLFSLVHPDEKYNPVSSPLKMHTLIRRLKQWLKENKIPVTVQEESRNYYLKADIPFALTVTRESGSLRTLAQRHLDTLRETFSGDFSIADAQKLLKCSRTYALEILKNGMEESGLSRFGNGRATKYRFQDEPVFKKAA